MEELNQQSKSVESTMEQLNQSPAETTMTTHPLGTLGRLPAELRFHVYSYLGLPRTGYTSALKGFMYPCHKAKDEIEAECVNYMKNFAKKLTNCWATTRRDWPALRITTSNTYADLGNVTISMPASPFWVVNAKDEDIFSPSIHRPMVVALRNLLVQPLSSLTINYYNDSDASPPDSIEGFHISLRLFKAFFIAFKVALNYPAKMDRIVLDFGVVEKCSDIRSLRIEFYKWTEEYSFLSPVKAVWLHSFWENHRERLHVGFDFKDDMPMVEGALHYDGESGHLMH